jgi:hypothetical protein
MQQWIRAQCIAKLGRAVDAPKRQVRALADFERADFIAPASASCGVKPNTVHAMFNARSIDVHGEVPGLQSVATAMRTPQSRSRSIGGGVV